MAINCPKKNVGWDYKNAGTHVGESDMEMLEANGLVRSRREGPWWRHYVRSVERPIC